MMKLNYINHLLAVRKKNKIIIDKLKNFHSYELEEYEIEELIDIITPTLKYDNIYFYLDSVKDYDNKTTKYIINEVMDINFNNCYFIKKFIKENNVKAINIIISKPLYRTKIYYFI